MDDDQWAGHQRAIDEAVRAAIEPGPEDVAVAWVTLVATRNTEGGGEVLRLLSNPTMPAWELKGILIDALDDIRHYQYDGCRDDG